MKIIHVKGGEYKDVLGSYDAYERYDDGSMEEVFFYGYNSSRDVTQKNKYVNYKRKVYLNLEAPCSFFTTSDAITSQAYFDQVYTICPYTAEWLNGSGETEYVPVLQPYNSDIFDAYMVMGDKPIDVIYHGGLYSDTHNKMIEVIQKHKYVFSSLFKNKGVTHRKISSRKKWKLIAKSKCSVGINLLYPNGSHITNVKTYNGWENNLAFSRLDERIVPQSKARVIEAAACHTLNLIKRDSWNVIERWFYRDEFVYWDTVDELDYLISDVSENFEKYIKIIDKAHQRAQQYTTQNFFKNVCDNIR